MLSALRGQGFAVLTFDTEGQLYLNWLFTYSVVWPSLYNFLDKFLLNINFSENPIVVF